MKPPNPLEPPFWNRLERSERILLAGMGGGFDVFCALPLAHALREMGKTVFLANFFFTGLSMTSIPPMCPGLYRVRAKDHSSLSYFPELYLAQFLAQQGWETPIYSFEKQGYNTLLEGYQFLQNLLEPDTIVLVDGGTDSLMRGDEFDLATPEEDALSLAVVDALTGPKQKLMACIGFGVDTFHGVCHAHFLASVAALTRSGHALGTFNLLPQQPAVQFYRQALEYAHSHMPDRISIVNSSVLGGIVGDFGNMHYTDRTQGGELFINALMGLYWTFDLEGVARRNMYLERIRETRNFSEVWLAIREFRGSLEMIKAWKDLPF
jgi:hypothetical protein